MAMVSPAVDAFFESVKLLWNFKLSTIKFAIRAKQVKNAPVINEDVDQRALLRKYEQELKVLR
jgi:hypothetical protein